MKARAGFAVVVAAWLARGGSSDANQQAARASAEAAVAVASASVTPRWATVVGPATPRLELPVEPPAFVDANPEVPPADPRTIHGAIYELGGEPCIGATVVATSPALVGEQVVITDEEGRYIIGGLPPGDYTLVVYYNNERTTVAGFEVRDDAATLAELVFEPMPDPPSEAVVVDVPPTIRDFAAPCADGECSFHSNCGLENTYIVDDDTTENVPTDRNFADEVTVPPEPDFALDKNYLRNTPVPGRTFDDLPGVAAGSQPGG